ncbi:patatin-like phospholipase domain-containing protein 2 isoform X2 [Daphnia pulex]|uniref:patatin-like phospholipase domain-containing protein 2 isoform X2 n=1 Tax=Daphnia pulex TaxID=6669 RepID=UPI001EE08A03|nr:patatin-like phospholipase domain-containing protein 2 isoform X2 [Daphnia pulex]
MCRHGPADLHLKKVAGASSGVIPAVALLCNISIEKITDHILKIAELARSRLFGPFRPFAPYMNDLIRQGLEEYLPSDAHVRVNGKIHISVTRVYDGGNIILKNFDSRDELIQALTCSCYLPFFFGLIPPKFREVHYMDGGLSNNLVVLDEHTITVSFFSGDSHICPQDKTNPTSIYKIANLKVELSWTNAQRLALCMFPPDPETLLKTCQQGFDDARLFLQRNNLVACNQCVFSMYPVVGNDLTNIINCLECDILKNMLKVGGLSEVVTMTLVSAVTQANQGLMNRILQHPKMRLLTFLSVPYIIPIDVAFGILIRFAENASTISTVGTNLKELVDFISAFMKRTS